MENPPYPQVKEGLHPWFRRDGGGRVAVPFYSVQGCRFDIDFTYFVVFFRDCRASELRKGAWKSPAMMKLTRCHFSRGWRYRARALTLRGLNLGLEAPSVFLAYSKQSILYCSKGHDAFRPWFGRMGVCCSILFSPRFGRFERNLKSLI